MEDRETPIESLLRDGKDLRRDITSLKGRVQTSATIQEDMPTKTPSSTEALRATIVEKIDWDGQVQKDFDAETLRIAEERKVSAQVSKKDFGLPKEGVLAETPTPAETNTDKLNTQSGIPFMITNAMKAELAELGFSAEKIRGMTPEDAHVALNAQEKKSPTSFIVVKEQIEGAKTDTANNTYLQNNMEMAEVAHGSPEKPLFYKENLSPFEQGIVNQENIEGLAELLVSKEYKGHVFGGGTRAVTGTEMAKRISEKVIQAKNGSQVDPYFFIPDTILANKVHELLETSLSWQESVSEFGTLSFEKKDSEIKEEVARKATEATIRKVAAVTNPGMWKKMTSWIKTGREAKELKATQVRTRFWASLGVALGLWGVTEAMDVEKTSTPVSTSTEATVETSQPNVKTQKIDKLFNEAKSSSVKASTSVPSVGMPAQSKPDAQPLPTNAPAGIPTQPEVGVTSIADMPASGVPTQPEVDVVPANIEGAENDPDQIFFPAQIEKPVVAQEKPEQFYSINEMRNWFSQDKQKLAALERVLHYADGQEEESSNGQPNVRAFWWETMQLENVTRILPKKAGPQNRNLTLQYVSIVGRAEIKRPPGLDDNQFMTTGAKLRDFDGWCRNSLFPATQQLEQKITQEEKEVLANTTQTLGEYLTQVVYLGEKYGVQIKGIPTLTEAQQQKVQNFQPIKTENKIPVTNTENLASQERGVSPTENTYWADYALRNASLYGVGNSISNDEWLNGAFENMIGEYGRVQKEMKRKNRGYTKEDLTYLKAQFEELRRRADSLGTNGTAFIVGNFSEEASLRQVDRVLADIETQLGVFQ